MTPGSNRFKVWIVTTVVTLPVLFLIWRDFFYYRRGWHTPDVQIQVTLWIARLLLTPFVLFFINWRWVEFNRPVAWLLKQTSGLVFFLVLNLGISFMLTKLLVTLTDSRMFNLLNTIWQQSAVINGVFFASLVMTYYAWIYFERHQQFVKRAQSLTHELDALRAGMNSDESEKPGLIVKNGSRITRLPLQSVVAFLADGPYVKVLSDDGRTHLVSQPLYEFEKFSSHGFQRVHRSRIVRLNSIQHLQSLGSGDFILTLDTGLKVRASRTYRDTLRSWLENRQRFV